MIGLLALAHAAPPSALAVSADGSFAIVGLEDGTRTVWRRDGSQVPVAPLALEPASSRTLSDLPRGAVRSLVLSADGRTAASAHEAGVVVVFDPRTGRERGKVPIDLEGPIPGPWTTLDVTVALDGPVARCGNGPRDLEAPALSADGRRLLTVGVHERQAMVSLWDTRRGTRLRTWTSDEPVDLVSFDDDDEPVILTGSELVVLGEVPRFVAHEVRSAAPDPGSDRIRVVGRGGAGLLDLATGAVTATDDTIAQPEGSGFHGRSADGAVQVWVGSDGVPRFRP